MSSKRHKHRRRRAAARYSRSVFGCAQTATGAPMHHVRRQASPSCCFYSATTIDFVCKRPLGALVRVSHLYFSYLWLFTDDNTPSRPVSCATAASLQDVNPARSLKQLTCCCTARRSTTGVENQVSRVQLEDGGSGYRNVGAQVHVALE